MTTPSLVEQYRQELSALIASKGLLDTDVSVLVKPLTPEEAIGTPTRKDYPILEGQERIIEAEVLGARGQAFTDAPSNFTGKLSDILALPLDSSYNRAIFYAVTNATLNSMSLVEGTLHCKDDAPQECAADMAQEVKRRGVRSVGLIGLNPSIAEALVGILGASAVHITDLNPKNLGAIKFGVPVWNGKTDTRKLFQLSDLVIVTGTTLVNGTFEAIHSIATEENKPMILFGISSSGFCKIMGIERWCAQGGKICV